MLGYHAQYSKLKSHRTKDLGRSDCLTSVCIDVVFFGVL